MYTVNKWYEALSLQNNKANVIKSGAETLCNLIERFLPSSAIIWHYYLEIMLIIVIEDLNET